jgi:hypothetical protein
MPLHGDDGLRNSRSIVGINDTNPKTYRAPSPLEAFDYEVPVSLHE